MSLGIDLRLMVFQPQDLGGNVSGAHRSSKELLDLFGAVITGQILHLISRPGINAVQNRFSQGPAVLIHRNTVAAQGAGPHSGDLVRCQSGGPQQLIAEQAEIVPPHRLGIVFIVIGSWILHSVGNGGLDDDPALLISHHTFAAEGADVDPHEVFTHQNTPLNADSRGRSLPRP